LDSWDDKVLEKAAKAKVLLLGGSAGSSRLIFSLIEQLPADFPLPIVVVIHRSRKFRSEIEVLLNSRSALSVCLAEDKAELRQGSVYFAPPDYHLLLEPDGTFTLDYSEPVFFSRPSIDSTFVSVSDVYQDKVVAVLLSGANADGSEGLCYIQERNGVAIIQDPSDAEVKTMPESAISLCKDALILSDESIFDFIKSIKKEQNF
jgi:two-component system chemotaxis response regulator CheB